MFSQLSSKILLAGLLIPLAAWANDKSPPDSAHSDKDAGLEAQLDDARHRLEEAARQVAELSSQLGGPFFERFSTFDTTYGRAIIGVQLDPSGGKDGARVVSVSPGGPAAEAGIRPGDVIVAVNGTTVTGEDATRLVVKVIHDAKPDSKINVRVKRDGKTQDVTVVARPGPGFMAFGEGLPPQLPQMSPMGLAKPFFMIQGPLSNMELVTLTPQLGKYFGTEKGVLVVRAPPDGALKLEDGDVILAIDGREPTSGSHATRILGSYQPGEKLSLKIVRQRKTMDLETTVPEEERRGFVVPGRVHDLPRPERGRVIIRHRDDDTI